MTPDISRNFNKSVNVYRFNADESGDGEHYTLHLESVSCHIQPLDESPTEDLTGNFGKDWLMFTDSMDIVEGDRIVDGDDESGSGYGTGIVYQVVGVERYEFLGSHRHMELRIRKTNA